MTVSQSPAVRLHISIKDTQAVVDEQVIKRLDKGYEIVDVNGFTFKRKTRGEGSAQQPCNDPYYNAHIVRITDADERSTHSAAGDPEIQQQDNNDFQKGAIAFPAPVEDVDTQPGIEVDHSVPEAQDNYADRDTENKELDVDDLHEANSFFSAPQDVAVDMAAQCLEEGTEAGRLEMLCHNLIQTLTARTEYEFSSLEEDQCSAHLVEQVLTTFAEGLHDALRRRTLICSETQSTAPPTLSISETKESRKRKALQAQLDRFTKEQEDWQVEMEQSKLVASQSKDSHVDEDVRMHEANTLDSQLMGLETGAHNSMTRQVDGVCAMTAGAAELLDQAEQLCRLMQVEYHREKFLQFPHIDSPARLIREIVKPRLFRLGA